MTRSPLQQYVEHRQARSAGAARWHARRLLVAAGGLDAARVVLDAVTDPPPGRDPRPCPCCWGMPGGAS